MRSAFDLTKWKHGSYSTYAVGCRCHRCTVAQAEYTYNLRRRRAEALKADPSLRPHGDRSTYTAWGCRCEPCVAAKAAYAKARRQAAAS